MKRIFLILLAVFLAINLTACAGISYYFQPSFDSNIKWSTEDDSVWFIHSGEGKNLACVYEKNYSAAFDYSNKLDFWSIDKNGKPERLYIGFDCKFKHNKIVATVRYDRDDILGVGTVVTFYKYDISEET